MKKNNFNIRVYGLLINKDQEVLLSYELVKGKYIAKFPGGGLEQGEGLLECLKREWQEELDVPVEILEHFYTTDFYVESFLGDGSQIISIYYLVSAEDIDKINVLPTAPDKSQLQQGKELHRWINIKDLSADDLSLIIDKKVAEMLKERIV